jgi:glutathione S-transferase
MRPTLFIGNKRLSSWSMRPWLALRAGGIELDEHVVRLDVPEERASLREISPNGKVPFLSFGGVRIGESIAICEWAAERSPSLWPAERLERAVARGVAAEMHAGFAAMRRELSMDLKLRTVASPSLEARADIARVRAIWRGCRAEHGAGGDFLFGAFSIADCMFAPVATRFESYGIELDGEEARYAAALLAHPAVREWCEAGRRE